MSPRRLTSFPLLLLLALATSASAQDDPGSRPVAAIFPEGFNQVVYKGLVGKVLDDIPMDPIHRVGLQRTNAVVSNTLFGRSLAAWVGLSNPVLLLGGLIWGIWAASNITPAEAGTNVSAEPSPSSSGAAAQERLVALLAPSTAVDDAPDEGVSEPVLLSLLSDGGSDEPAVPPSHVVKIWLPQPAPIAPR